MAKPFEDKRRILWLIGGAAVLIGVLAWGLMGPSTDKLPGGDGPQVDVPRMTNVPTSPAPKLDIETGER